jgi:DNA replication and repair protein RecF
VEHEKVGEMSIKTLSIYTFRNLTEAHLTLSPFFNLIAGENGAGKSSILEAVYFLSHGRSFRGHVLEPLVQFNQQKTILQALITTAAQNEVSVGVMKSLIEDGQIKIGGELCRSAVELAALLPVQLLNADSFDLLNGGPAFRRQWMDWGLFHVEHAYGDLWRRYNHVLKQRNAALKKEGGAAVRCWDEELTQMGEKMALQRAQYIEQIMPLSNDIFGRFCDFSFYFQYERGWGADLSLRDALHGSLARDQHLGYTSVGPHRADLKLSIENKAVQAILSRGQQKWLIYSLKLAQGQLLKQQTDKNCVYLLDDVPAEWDAQRQKILIGVLRDMLSQVLITGIDLSYLYELTGDLPTKMFHVERGVVTQQQLQAV